MSPLLCRRCYLSRSRLVEWHNSFGSSEDFWCSELCLIAIKWIGQTGSGSHFCFCHLWIFVLGAEALKVGCFSIAAVAITEVFWRVGRSHEGVDGFGQKILLQFNYLGSAGFTGPHPWTFSWLGSERCTNWTPSGSASSRWSRWSCLIQNPSDRRTGPSYRLFWDCCSSWTQPVWRRRY